MVWKPIRDFQVPILREISNLNVWVQSLAIRINLRYKAIAIEGLAILMILLAFIKMN